MVHIPGPAGDVVEMAVADRLAGDLTDIQTDVEALDSRSLSL